MRTSTFVWVDIETTVANMIQYYVGGKASPSSVLKEKAERATRQ